MNSFEIAWEIALIAETCQWCSVLGADRHPVHKWPNGGEAYRICRPPNGRNKKTMGRELHGSCKVIKLQAVEGELQLAKLLKPGGTSGASGGGIGGSGGRSGLGVLAACLRHT